MPDELTRSLLYTHYDVGLSFQDYSRPPNSAPEDVNQKWAEYPHSRVTLDRVRTARARR